MAGLSVKDFLIRCMEIESISGDEEKFGIFLEKVLQSDGWIVERQMVGDTGKRFNLIATRKPMSEHNVARLVLNSHLDTVPPYIPPTFDEVNIYGRGCNEAKGQLAAMVLAANRLVVDHPSVADQIALVFVVGEDVDHAGMIAANSLPFVRPEYLVVGEPTELKFASAQKGVMKVHIRCTGKAGHSGYPHTGTSAIHKLIPIVNEILTYEWPVDERNVADIRARLEALVGDRGTLDYSLGGNDPCPLSSPPFPCEQEAVAFNSDMPYYEKKSELKGAFLYGAGSITTAFSEGEVVAIKDLETAVDTYYKLAIELLN